MRHLQPALSDRFATLQSFASLPWTRIIALILPLGLTWLTRATAPLVGCGRRPRSPRTLLRFQFAWPNREDGETLPPSA